MLYAIAGQTLDDQMPLSDRYVLADLIKTNTIPQDQNIPYPNSPELTNLKWLAKTLEELEDTIGPFTIISAFRTNALQNAITGKNPNASHLKSFHEAGMAVDIFPTSMPPEEYFGRLVASNWVQNLGEIALKPSQNTLHLSLPGKFVGKVLIMSSDKIYVSQTPEQVAAIAGPYLNESISYELENSSLSNSNFQEGMEALEDSGEGADYEVNTLDLMQSQALKKKLLIGGSILIALVGIYFYIRKIK